jgi:O-antigen ligase/Flp pilus assembly protein TadD
MSLKSITRFISLAALFLIPFFPLIVANSFFFPFITGKAFYFRALVEIAFASWVILAFLDARYRPKLNALTIGVTIFALVTLVADLVGVNPIRSLWSNFERMEGWITVIHLWMFFMVASSIFAPSAGGREPGVVAGQSNKILWHRWMNVSLVVAFLVACYGFAQLFGWVAIHQSAARVDASLGNSAYMAVYMLLSAGFAAYLFLESRARRAGTIARETTDKGIKIVGDIIKAFDLSALEWIYAVLVVAFSFLLYETATRGTILGLVGGIVIGLSAYAIFAGKRKNANGNSSTVTGGTDISSPSINQSRINRSRWVSGGIVGLFAIGIFAFIGLRHQPFIANSPVLGRLASISFSSTESVARLYIWQEALIGASQHPILGWGQENFNYIFNANYNPVMWSQEQWFDRAHSVYFDWLVNSGIVGLLAYLALYVLFLLAVWKSTLSVAEKSVLTGLLAGYAVHNIFVFDNLASYVLFFAMLGFAASLPRKISKTGAANSLDSLPMSVTPKIIGGTKEIGSEVIEYVVAPVAIIALVFGLYWFNWRPIQENTRLITALQSCSNGSAGSVPDPSLFQNALSVGAYVGYQEIREQILSCAGSVISSQQIPGPTKEAFFTLATGEIQAQIAATPKDARIYALAGSFMDQIGAFSQAEPILIDAHLLSPAKQTIDFELGNDYINEGKLSQAVDIFKQAYHSATDNTDAKVGYATAMVIDGQDAQAHTIFGDDPTLFNTVGMARAYTAAKQYPKALAIYQNLIGTSTDNTDLELALAQTQYAAGMISQAVATLKVVETAHPEYASQIDAAIKQVQAGK